LIDCKIEGRRCALAVILPGMMLGFGLSQAKF